MNDDTSILNAFRGLEDDYLSIFPQKPRIGYLCLRTPVELIEVLDAIPLRIIPQSGYDANLHTGIRSDGCSFCQNIPTFLKTSHYQGLKAIIGGACCDQMRRVMDTLHAQLQIPVILYGAPRTWETEESYFFGEMAGAFQNLASILNVPFNSQIIKGRIIARNALRVKINDLRSKGLLANIALNALSASHLPPEKILEFLSSLPGHREKHRIRLLLAGSIPGWWEAQTIAESGAEIVADATCMGDRAFHRIVEVDGDPMEHLYRAYVADNLCPHRRPYQPTIDYIKQLAAEREVDGIIFLTLKYCHPWGLSAVRMKEDLGLPFLRLDDDLTSPAVGNFKTRVGAFVEMLEARKSK